MGWFLIKRFVDLFRVCYVISRDHSSTFFLVNLQETNLSKEKHSSKGYLFSYQIFDSLDILISAELSLLLKKFKLYQENRPGRGVYFNEPVQAQKVEST